ncbi:peptidylprolyl isomerase, partial [Sarracenia purpurea var. burkii]
LSDSLTDTESESKSASGSDDGNADVKGLAEKHSNQAQITIGKRLSSTEERAASITRNKGEATDISEREEGEYPKENGEPHSNGIEMETKSDRSADRPDIVDDHPGKSRFTSHSYQTSVIVYSYGFFQIWYFIES